jgi:hypothetical protein
MKRKPKRFCFDCKRANGGLHDICNVCRAKNCEHKEAFHYDSAHNKICSACGFILAKTNNRGTRNDRAGSMGKVAQIYKEAEQCSP